MTETTEPTTDDELVNVEDLSDHNPVEEGQWAVDDDGNRYLVARNNFNAATALVPEKYVLTDEKRSQREGAGEPCERCGEEIGIRDIIVNDKRTDETGHYHYGCYNQTQGET